MKSTIKLVRCPKWLFVNFNILEFECRAEWGCQRHNISSCPNMIIETAPKSNKQKFCFAWLDLKHIKLTENWPLFLQWLRKKDSLTQWMDLISFLLLCLEKSYVKRFVCYQNLSTFLHASIEKDLDCWYSPETFVFRSGIQTRHSSLQDQKNY